MAVIDAFRYAADNGNSAVALTSLNGYAVYLVQITNEQVGFDDTNTGRIRTDTRLTVGIGYSSTAPGDGYLNPHIQYYTQMNSSGVEILAGAALTDMDLLLGPLAFPYDTGYASGGMDPAVFQPLPQANTEIYIHLIGLGLNANNGNYYRVNEILLGGLDNITYYVRLSSISDIIP